MNRVFTDFQANVGVWVTAEVLAHEINHCLGLHHNMVS